jgi:hypothetical protein
MECEMQLIGSVFAVMRAPAALGGVGDEQETFLGLIPPALAQVAGELNESLEHPWAIVLGVGHRKH